MTTANDSNVLTFNHSDLKRDKCPTCKHLGPYQVPEDAPLGLRTWSSDGTLTITPYADPQP